MLSNEEKKAIEYLKIEYEKLMKEDNILFPLYKSDAKRLIDIIEKQSKEIEELKVINQMQKYRIEEIDERELISKDKIKAKIEEYDDKEMTVNLANRSAGKTFQQAVRNEVRKVLQSLLEKE